MGEPATKMDSMDPAKASRGLDIGLKNAMASDLDELRWRPLFRSQLWTLWVRGSIEATWCTSMDASVPIYSWVSSAYSWKDTRFVVSDRSGFITLATGDMKSTKKWARDRALGHICGYCFGGWGWWVDFDKGWAICNVETNPRDDKAWQTKSMLKYVKKCGVIKSIECHRHVESS